MFTEQEKMDLLTPAFCPSCGGLMRGKSHLTWSKYRCCVDCFIYFLEDRPQVIQRWLAGWRPSPEEMERFRELMKS
jgi:hypothetical protein